MADQSSSLPVRFGVNITSSGTLTVTSAANALALDCDGMSAAYIEIPVGTASAASALCFEGTVDDTNWFFIDAYRINTGAAPGAGLHQFINGATGLTGANLPARVVVPGINGLSQIRVRVLTTGTGTTGTIVVSGGWQSGLVSLAQAVSQGAAYTAGDPVIPFGAVRRDAGTALTGTGQQYGPLATDTTGRLWINGGQIDNDGTNAFTLGTSTFLTLGAFAVAVGASPATAVTATRAGALAMTPNRSLRGVIMDAADSGRGANVDSSNRLTVVVSSANTATDLGKGEDAAHASGDTGVMSLFVRQASTPTDKSAGNTDGDYEPGQVDAQGALYVNAAINSRTDSARKIIIKTKASLAANTATTTDLDNTVTTGKTFVLKGFLASASGKIKLDFQSGSTSQIVAFNSTANPNIFVEFAQPIEFASTVVMHPIITNNEASAMDVYITYWGVEV